jgi:hypothetical protein
MLTQIMKESIHDCGRFGQEFLKIKNGGRVVKNVGLSKTTQEYDIEYCDGKRDTIHHTLISEEEVTTEEEREFLRKCTTSK